MQKFKHSEALCVATIVDIFRIHAECEGGKVCTKAGRCKLLQCREDKDCENQVKRVNFGSYAIVLR